VNPSEGTRRKKQEGNMTMPSDYEVYQTYVDQADELLRACAGMLIDGVPREIVIARVAARAVASRLLTRARLLGVEVSRQEELYRLACTLAPD